MQYMVRVEIHNADRWVYDRLHAAMAVESLSRVITGARDGKKYHMPIGTYWTEAIGDAWTVVEAAKRAALPIDARAEIAVSGDGQIVFYGCSKIEQPRPTLASLLAPLPTPAHPWTPIFAEAPPAPKRDSLAYLLAEYKSKS